MNNVKTIDAAQGRWKGVLIELGIERNTLSGKHTSCPLCGGKDRFRFDNKNGSGSYICSGCGSGYGMDLAMKFTGYGFKELADKIDLLVNNVDYDPKRSISSELSEEKRKALMRQVWVASNPVAKGDLVDKYLTGRGLHNATYPKSLRYAQQLNDGSGSLRPCMIGVISDVEGNIVQLHRTFLGGKGKAIMDNPRKMMVGPIPEGSAIRLTDTVDPHLGIAEGIETAMSASQIFDMPVWAVVSTAMMEKFKPPQGVEKISIFADNDVNYAGQKAAYSLAHRLTVQGFEVDVVLPQIIGEDWNDVVVKNKSKGE